MLLIDVGRESREDRRQPVFRNPVSDGATEEGLLRFDQDAAGWIWDLVRIRAKGYSDNVVDLMVGKLSRFPNATQESRKHLACLGNSAEFDLLRTVYEDSKEEMHDRLREAVGAGLIFRSENSYRFLPGRVQEAATF